MVLGVAGKEGLQGPQGVLYFFHNLFKFRASGLGVPGLFLALIVSFYGGGVSAAGGLELAEPAPWAPPPEYLKVVWGGMEGIGAAGEEESVRSPVKLYAAVAPEVEAVVDVGGDRSGQNDADDDAFDVALEEFIYEHEKALVVAMSIFLSLLVSIPCAYLGQRSAEWRVARWRKREKEWLDSIDWDQPEEELQESLKGGPRFPWCP